MVKRQSSRPSIQATSSTQCYSVPESKNQQKSLANSHSVRYERWRPEEIERFDKAHAQFGNDWVLVSQWVQTRCRKQCRSHYQRHIANKEQRETPQIFRPKRAKMVDVQLQTVNQINCGWASQVIDVKHGLGNNIEDSDSYYNHLNVSETYGFVGDLGEIIPEEAFEDVINFKA